MSICLDPCIPNDWPGFEITLRRRFADLHITVENPEGVVRGVKRAILDGAPLDARPLRFELPDDGARHDLAVTLG